MISANASTINLATLLGGSLRKPIASEVRVGSAMALGAIRTAFPRAGGNSLTLFGIPVHVDPRIGYDNCEIWDQYGNLMLNVKIVLGGRRTGKTNKMLKWLVDAPVGEHRVLVSHSLQESQRLFRYAIVDRTLPLESWQFCAWSEVSRDAWRGVLFGRGGRIVLGFDNADLILSNIIGREVGALSIGGDLELADPVPWAYLA